MPRARRLDLAFRLNFDCDTANMQSCDRLVVRHPGLRSRSDPSMAARRKNGLAYRNPDRRTWRPDGWMWSRHSRSSRLEQSAQRSWARFCSGALLRSCACLRYHGRYRHCRQGARQERRTERLAKLSASLPFVRVSAVTPLADKSSSEEIAGYPGFYTEAE